MSNNSPLSVVVVGAPNAESDAAVARFLEKFLESERPGIAWRVRKTGSRRRLTVSASRKVDRAEAGGIDDELLVATNGHAVEAEAE